ncbi:MAG TPA: ATP-binding protein, partial [Nitrospirota bacterium]|nr:ATP-binding protein [Nitrospirota bacterium]
TAQLARARILLSTFSLAYLAALDFVPAFGIDWHPFGYIPIFLFVVIAARSITRYRFKTITPAFAAREITRAMNDGLIVLDPDGVVRLVNQAACGLFSCREQDLVGRRPMSGMTNSQSFAEFLESVVQSGTVHNFEVNDVRGDGSRRTLSLSTSIMRNPAGEALATVCMVNDVTDRKRTEEDREKLIAQLQEANRKLQVLDRMKSDFISVVSHDLRTPLTTIKAFAELIMMRPDMSLEQRSKFVNTINLECDRLKRLITDLLDLARIESGSMSWRVEQVCLKAAVLESITSMGLLFENKGINLTTEFPPSLPAVAADRDRIVQVVTNLLTNAAKFTPPGGVIHVSVSSESAHAEQVAVRISDTGVGIPAEDLELIFEKFRRSGGELTDATSGAGLGLAIARQIIENHGGRIWAESEQGKGSTFTFTLPLTRKEPPVVPSP